MKNYKQILEAINRGIQLALDDFDDDEQVQHVKSKQVQNRDYTKEYLDLMEEFVDLGLPSGTKWFKYNLGVDYKKLNENPENSVADDWTGDFYAWGETESKCITWNKENPNRKMYNLEMYKFQDLITDEVKLTKYNQKDKLIRLLPEDDAATQNSHNYNIHIPTTEQFEELLKYTTHKPVKNYNNIIGLNGVLFKGKYKNKNEIFLPNTGRCDHVVIINGECGQYWTSDIDSKSIRRANILYFRSRNINIADEARWYGCSIRPVIKL